MDFITLALAKKYTNSRIKDMSNFSVKIVEKLPTSNIDTHTIYFLPRTDTKDTDFYYEYMYINNLWELIGSTQIDLTDYWTSEEVKQYVKENEYILPIASQSSLGGIKVDGESISIDSKGTICIIDDYTTEKAKETIETVVPDVIDSSFEKIDGNDIDDLFN